MKSRTKAICELVCDLRITLLHFTWWSRFSFWSQCFLSLQFSRHGRVLRMEPSQLLKRASLITWNAFFTKSLNGRHSFLGRLFRQGYSQSLYLRCVLIMDFGGNALWTRYPSDFPFALVIANSVSRKCASLLCEWGIPHRSYASMITVHVKILPWIDRASRSIARNPLHFTCYGRIAMIPTHGEPSPFLPRLPFPRTLTQQSCSPL